MYWFNGSGQGRAEISEMNLEWSYFCKSEIKRDSLGSVKIVIDHKKKLDVAHSYTGQFCSQWISSYISRSKYILKISTFPFSWFLCLSNAILGNLLFKLVIARYPTFIPYLWNSVAKTNSGNGFSIHSLISKKNPRRHFSPTEDYDVYIVDMVLISKPLATQEIQLMVDIKFIQNGKRYADILTSAC